MNARWCSRAAHPIAAPVARPVVILVLVTLPTVACTFGDVVQRLFGGSRQAADSSWLTAAADILMPAAAPDKPTPTLLNESCTLLCFGGRNCSEVHGSWPLCEDGLSDRPRPLIYSIGIGSHINFDKAGRLSADERARFRFLPVGLGGEEGLLNFYSVHATGGGSLALGERDGQGGAPKGYHPHVELTALVARLPTLQLLAGDADETIDVLKVDAEGAEWKGLAEHGALRWLRARPPTQIVIEFHDRFRPHDGKQLRSAAAQVLQRCGYHMRHVSASNEEVLFVRTRLADPMYCGRSA